MKVRGEKAHGASARVGTHQSCTFGSGEASGGVGLQHSQAVRRTRSLSLTRTNSFLLSPQQINTALTSTQPDEQPRKHDQSETPRGLSHVTRPPSSRLLHPPNSSSKLSFSHSQPVSAPAWLLLPHHNLLRTIFIHRKKKQQQTDVTSQGAEVGHVTGR